MAHTESYRYFLRHTRAAYLARRRCSRLYLTTLLERQCACSQLANASLAETLLVGLATNAWVGHKRGLLRKEPSDERLGYRCVRRSCSFLGSDFIHLQYFAAFMRYVRPSPCARHERRYAAFPRYRCSVSRKGFSA